MCKLSPAFFEAISVSRGTKPFDYSALTDIDRKAIKRIKTNQSIRQRKIEYRKRLWWDAALENRRIDTTTIVR